MNVYISYFYNVRFFPTNLIPVSTAVWDPKWYHNFKTNDFIFKDKRGVVNGIRVEVLSPHKISDYIFSLNFNEVYNRLLSISQTYNNADICLMVYEKPNNPCSERATLVKWFANNGVEVKEFSRL